MPQTITLEKCSEEVSQSSLSYLIFQSKSFDAKIIKNLENNHHYVLKIESLTELVFHSRSFCPHIAFIGIDIVRLDHVDVRLIRQKLPKTYLYLLIEEQEDFKEIEHILELGFDDFWYRNEFSLNLLPLTVKKSERYRSKEMTTDALPQKKPEKTSSYRFVDCMSHHLMQPVEQLVQFAHIALQRNQRQQFSQVGHYLAEMKLIAQEVKAYIQDLKELFRLQTLDASLDVEEIDLTELLRKIKRQFFPIAESRHIHLEFSSHTEQPYAKGDFSKLSRVLNLLLRDLLKAMEEKGKLTLNLRQVNPYFEIVIQANALIYLDQLCLPLFELFEDKEKAPEQKNADFGLALCKELMKRQRGDLILSHERSQKRTEFVLKIPCLNSLFDD